MSFLSGFLCCFDSGDSSKKEIHSNNNNSSNNKLNSTKSTPASLNSKKSLNSYSNSNTSLNQLNRPKLSKTQSNLQKALTNSTTNIKTNNNTNSTPVDSIEKKNINKNNNNNISLSKSTAALSLQAPTPLPSNTNLKNLSETGNNSTSSSTSKLPDQSKSTEYTKMIEEISETKDSSNSSKNDDDIIQVHENQTQNTDDLDNSNSNSNNNNDNNNNNNNNNTANNFISTNNDNHNDNTNDNSNPISNIDPHDNNNITNTLNFEENLYDEQFGLDLTKILPDQAVSKSGWLLDEKPAYLKNKKCLVLDLDETLVHSSFKFVRQCDFVIPVEIENQIHNVYVIKRPGVDQFLKRVGQLFEVVVFTASVARYGDPLLDILDSHKSIHQRLFRDSCYNYQGNYIKNLSQMGRPLEDLIIIDNSPASYVFHPQHAVPISSWFSDSHDCELTDLLPFLEDLASSNVDDVRLVLDINI